MKSIITIALCLLYAGSCFAAGGVKINGDIILEQGSAPSRVLYFSNGSSQQFASPWSFLTPSTDIYYNPAIPGNVGIGTATPAYKLDILHSGFTGIRVKSSAAYSAVDIDAFNGDSALRFQNNGVTKWNIRNDPSNNSLQIFEQNSFERLRIINGQVGIGTSTPTATLDVNGSIKSSGNIIAGAGMTGTPLAHGVVATDGTWLTNSHSANITSITRNTFGSYTIIVANETLSHATHTTTLTISDTAPGFITYTYSRLFAQNGLLYVNTYDINGAAADRTFSFLIMKM